MSYILQYRHERVTEMNTSAVIEAIGYLGSALVLVSFLMASVVKLRIVNAVGSTIFAVYAFIIRSYPTAIMNVCLLLINLYYLWKLRSTDSNYSLLSLSPGDPYLRYFLERFGDDIRACFPERNWEDQSVDRVWMVLRGADGAGLLMGTERDGVLDIALDDSTPAYRDCSVGSFLLGHLPRGELRKLRYAGAEDSHLDYLRKMGFTARGGDYEKELETAEKEEAK